MEALAPKVAGFFPIIPGERLDDYAKRALVLKKGQRAMIAAYTWKASRELHDKRQPEKNAWIAAARLKFSPGERRPCKICGKYRSLTQAHHIVPLAIQFEAGATEPIDVHVWLCPTHHAAEHVSIDAILKNRPTPSFDGMPIEEKDALLFSPDGKTFVELLTKFPHWQRVMRSRVASAISLPVSRR
jgi:hypothetical protein